jgi:lipopolysaccharide biosynthesis glycosyltransferase
MEKPIIVFSVNNEFISYLMVALRTLGRNNKYPIEIYIIYSDLSEGNLTLLEKICDDFNYKLKSIKINSSMFDGAPEMGHLKIETYYRLAIPNLVQAKKVLYLDCDIYINGNIKDIFDINIDNFPIAAVKDPGFQPLEKLKMSTSATYFNAGVLLINLEYWRKINLSKVALEFAINNIMMLSYADQCALNATINGNYYSLKNIYNFQSGHILNGNKVELEELKNSKIIHFTGSFKPTHFLNKHPFKEEYMKEFRNTPDYYRLKFKNFVRIFLKNIYLESLPSLARKYRLIK